MDEPVINPEFVTVKEPPPVVIIEPFRTKLLPTRMIPTGPLVLRLPFKNSVPVDEATLIDAALNDCMVMSWALLTRTDPKRVAAPASC